MGHANVHLGPGKTIQWAMQKYTVGHAKVHSGPNQNLFLMFVACRSVGERKPRSRSLVRRSSNKVCCRGFYLEGTFCVFQGSGLWTELGTLEWWIWISRSMLDPPFFFNLETNLILNKIQPIRFAYQKPVNLKFCAPFMISIQKREELSSFKKPVFWYFCTLSKIEWIKQEIKSVRIGYSD